MYYQDFKVWQEPLEYVRQLLKGVKNIKVKFLIMNEV